ncbi:uncharacterized protein LOC143066910 isoform X3 [Mytilus galloprovincialis]|uniref:uncharacterized protein LOC143066910 isoform X3 n=1 Tax=Mytilus galloprovincialis TaxID=29158 RepID=UPI003F7C541F
MRKRENFYRICTAIVDHGKEALVMLLQKELKKRNESFEDFIKRNQHEIYHLCHNRVPCCQCSGGTVPKGTPKVLFVAQLDILLDTTPNLKCQSCNTPGKFKCCHPAKKGLTESELDVTLLRCLLVNLVPDLKTPIANYCAVRKAVEDLTKHRNQLYAHAKSGEIDDADYKRNMTDIRVALVKIAEFCKNKAIMEGKLNSLENLSDTHDFEERYQDMLQELKDNSKGIKLLKRSVSEFGEAQNRIGIKVMKSLHSVEQETTELSRSTDGLRRSTDALSGNTDGLSRSTDGLSRSTDGLRRSTDALSGNTEALSRIAEGLSRSTDALHRSTEESNRMAEESQRSKLRAAVCGTVVGAVVATVVHKAREFWNTPSTSQDDSS